MSGHIMHCKCNINNEYAKHKLHKLDKVLVEIIHRKVLFIYLKVSFAFKTELP